MSGEKAFSVVLASHGSRSDELARALRILAENLRRKGGFPQVLLAYHQGRPAFREVLSLVSRRKVVVVPLFMAEGYYTRVVLPRELRKNTAGAALQVHVTAAVGSHGLLRSAMLKRCRKLLDRTGWNPERTAVIVLGHGTRRSSTSRLTALRAADHLSSKQVFGGVAAAFLADSPSPAEAVRDVTMDHFLILPFLIGGGLHTGEIGEIFLLREDRSSKLRQFLGRDALGRKYLIDRPVGEDPVVEEIIGDLIQQRLGWTLLKTQETVRVG